MNLSAGEVYQLLIQTVTDVNLTEDERSTAKSFIRVMKDGMPFMDTDDFMPDEQ